MAPKVREHIDARAMLDALLERSTAAILIVDDHRNYVDASQAACEMLGIEIDHLLTKKIEDLTPADNRAQVEEEFNFFLQQGTLAGRYELRRADGELLDVHYSATAHVLPGMHMSIFTPIPQLDPEIDRDVAPSPLVPTSVTPEDNGNVSGFAPNGQSERLSEREVRILSMLALGETNNSIAQAMHLAPDTVRNYTRSARLKLGAKSRSHAIAVAVASGQLDPAVTEKPR